MSQIIRLANRRWIQISTGGLLLFIATEQALKITGNPNYFPTVILIGSLLIPVSFIAYVYEHIPAREVSLSCLLICFLGGGTVGLLAAGLLEYGSLVNLGIGSLILVGLIEETAKLILPTVRFISGRYRSEADGLLFGVAAGMGFAALETMGYGTVSLIQSRGSLGTLEEVLLLRGVISPAGHGAWTGLVCAVLWRERSRKKTFSLPLLGTFALAVFLHTLWNVFNGPSANSLIFVAGDVAVAAVSLGLLVNRMHEAIRQRTLDYPIVSEES